MIFSSHGSVHYSSFPFELMNLAGKCLKDLYQFIMFSSIFVGLAAMGMVYTSCFIQELPIGPPAMIIMFLTAYSVYNLNRKTDEDEDVINHEGRYAFTKKNEGVLFLSAIFAYAGAVGIAIFSGPYAVFVTLIPLLSGVLYSMKWLPPGFRYRRLKDIPVIKNIVVALAWSSMLSLLPVSLTGAIPDEEMFIAFFMFFSYAFIASTIPDIRDRNGDALAGIITIPVLYGERKTKEFLIGFNLVSCLFLIGISFATLPLGITSIIAITMIYIHICLALLGNPSLKKYVYDLFADGQFLFLGSALFFMATAHVFPSL